MAKPKVSQADSALQLTPVPLNLCLKYHQHIKFPIFVPISSGKNLEIDYHPETIVHVLKKFETKGLKGVFFKNEDYGNFHYNLKKVLESGDDSLPPAQLAKEMTTMAEAFQLIKTSMTEFGFTSASLIESRAIYKRSTAVIQESSALLNLFRDFSKSQFKEFSQNIFVVYVSSSIIQTFDWQSNLIMEKSSLAALLCDIQMLPEEQELLTQYYYGKDKEISLSKTISQHPCQTANFLAKEGALSRETIDMIKEHHLRPDGTAFPKEASFCNVSVLSAIHILARHFVELLYQYDFDPDLKEIILKKLMSSYKTGSFKKAMRGLLIALDETKLKFDE